jgi:hypothetical protein
VGWSVHVHCRQLHVYTGMKKSLDSVPQSFSVGFVESTDHKDASQFAATHASTDEHK